MSLRFKWEEYDIDYGKKQLRVIRYRMKKGTYLEGTSFRYKGYHIAERIYTGKYKYFPDSWFVMDKRYFTLRRVSQVTGIDTYELNKRMQDGTLPPPTCLAWAFDVRTKKYKLIRLFSTYKITVIKETIDSPNTVKDLHYVRRKPTPGRFRPKRGGKDKSQQDCARS